METHEGCASAKGPLSKRVTSSFSSCRSVNQDVVVSLISEGWGERRDVSKYGDLQEHTFAVVSVLAVPVCTCSNTQSEVLEKFHSR